MKTNVISNSFTVPFDTNGSLEIIGKKGGLGSGKVVFLVKGQKVHWFHHELPDFCKNAITTWSPDDSGTPTLIFEYMLREGLKNPQKLLKSIRNKLMRSAYTIQTRQESSEREYYENYVQPTLNNHAVL